MTGAGGDIRHIHFFNAHNEAGIAALAPDMYIANAAVTSDMVFIYVAALAAFDMKLPRTGRMCQTGDRLPNSPN